MTSELSGPLLSAEILEGRLMLASQSPLGQNLLLNKTQFGANDGIVIDVGRIGFVRARDGNLEPETGISDSFFPITDVYIVPAGVSNGARLSDVSGRPNTIFGGFGGGVGAEVIGFTGPAGTVPPGSYAVVFDEAQNGVVDPYDAIFDDAFTVVIPPNVPPLPNAFGAMKAEWSAQADGWAARKAMYQGLFNAITFLDLFTAVADSIPGRFPSFLFAYSFTTNVVASKFLQIPGAGDVALLQTAQMVGHYRGLAADPPDAAFRQNSPLSANTMLNALGQGPLQQSFVSLANSLRTEGAIANALLQSAERYQGADVEQNPEWALIHAIALQDNAALLIEQYDLTNDALGRLRDRLISDPANLEGASAAIRAAITQAETTGFDSTETRELRNAGWSDEEIEALRGDVAATDPGLFDRSAIVSGLNELIAANVSAANGLMTLISEMAQIIEGLEADYSVAKRAPRADAGNGYVVDAGVPLVIDGARSLDPDGSLVGWAWDLDLDGKFDDATGQSPTVRFENVFDGLIGLQVTDADGRTGIDYARITVGPSNTPPIVVASTPESPLLEATVGIASSFEIAAVDSDDDSFQINWFVDGQLAANGSRFDYTPEASDFGVRAVRAEVTDSQNGNDRSVREWVVAVLQADSDGDQWHANLDCNDADAAVSPGMVERIGDGIDNDCNPNTVDVGELDLALSSVDISALSFEPRALRIDGPVVVTIENHGGDRFDPKIAGIPNIILFQDMDQSGTYEDAVDKLLGSATYDEALESGASSELSITVSDFVQFRDNLVYAAIDLADDIPENDETNNISHSGLGSLYRPIDDWQPMVEWQWDDSSGSAGVDHPPIVSPLIDTNGDGLVNELDIPVVIVGTATGNVLQESRLVALRGDTGEVIFSVGGQFFQGQTPAVGDLDGDGIPEVVVVNSLRSTISAFNNDGSLRWEVDEVTGRFGQQPQLTLADLNGDGTSEILFNTAIYNFDGSVRTVVPTNRLHPPAGFSSQIVVDLDLDGDLEIVSSASASDADGNLLWQWTNGRFSFGGTVPITGRLDGGETIEMLDVPFGVPLAGAGVAVANVDGDPYPEILAFPQFAAANDIFHSMWIFEHDGRIHSGPIPLIEQQAFGIQYEMGQPTIADFDGDGQVEVAIKYRKNPSQPLIGLDDKRGPFLQVYETDGTLLWGKTGAADSGGNFESPVSAFDFDADGAVEILFQDDQQLQILNGRTGETRFDLGVNRHHIGTTHYPTVVDVDNDGNAEIVVSTGNFSGTRESGSPPRNGLLVLGDANDNWVHARRIWNQWQYNVNNVEKDGGIPVYAEPSWLEHNTFRSQLPIEGVDPFAAPDISVSRVVLGQNDCDLAQSVLRARIGNGGSLHAGSGLSVRLYLGDPSDDGKLLNEVATTQVLQPGAFEDVLISFDHDLVLAEEAGELWVTVNEQPVAQRQLSENLAQLPHTFARAEGLGGGAFTFPENTGVYLAIDGEASTAWNNFYEASGSDFDPRDPFYEVRFPFPVEVDSVTIENVGARGFLTGVLELSNGFATPFAFDENGEGSIQFAEQTGVTWARITSTETRAGGASVSEFVVGGSFATPEFLLNEGVGRLGNNTARLGFDRLNCESPVELGPVVFAGADITIDEGQSITLAGANFVSQSSSGQFSAEVNWGNGTIQSATIVENGNGGTLIGRQDFLESGVFTSVVTVTSGAGLGGSDERTITVRNLPPVVEVGDSQRIEEGASLQLLGSFVDPGVFDSHQATIDWGDGSPIETVAVEEVDGSGVITGEHVFANDGVFKAVVCVIDDEGTSGCDELDVTVENAVPVVEAGPDQQAVEGDLVRLNGASLFDAGSADTHTVFINWGDNLLTRFGSVDLQSGDINASYQYEDSGTFTVSVRVVDSSGAESSDSFVIVVENATPVVEVGPDQTVFETLSMPPAWFRDAGLADIHTATIDWGDGHVDSGLVNQWRGSGLISGSHTYAEDGTFTVVVHVTDDDGATSSDRFVATVSKANQPPAIVPETPATIDEGGLLEFAFAITDSNPDDTHTAMIDWGDGSLPQSIPLENNLKGFASGFPAHRYLDDGTYEIRIFARDNRGGESEQSSKVLVRNVAPTVEAGADLVSTVGEMISLTDVFFTDLGIEDTHTATIDWGDDTVSVGTISRENDSFVVLAEHSYASEGNYSVRITVEDDDGASSYDSFGVTVAPPTGELPNVTVSEVIVNDGDAQRSNIETISIRFSDNTNLQTLIDDGTIVDAVGLVGSAAVPLSADRFSLDSATSTLVIDVSVDGIGGSRSTMLDDGRYAIRMNVALLDDDTNDGLRTYDFHRLLGDFDGNANVDLLDRNLFFSLLGADETGEDDRYKFAYDLNKNSLVDASDYRIFKLHYGRIV